MLRATYDKAVVNGLTDLARLAGNLQRFEREHARRRDRVCHLRSIGVTIERLLFEMGHDWVPIAIGFHATSVVPNPWRIQDEQGDESRPYSLLIDDAHHWTELVPDVFGEAD